RIAQLRATELENLEEDGDRDWRPGSEIELDRITHLYSGSAAPALEKAAIRLPKGTHVAVTGRSGSGKTTLAQILARLFEPTEGQLLDAGSPVDQIGLYSYRRQVL